MPVYTKKTNTIQYTEVIYFMDGEQINSERLEDAEVYDSTDEEPMTDDEIEDWGWE